MTHLSLTKEQGLKFYHFMLMTFLFEEELYKLYKRGLLPSKVFTSTGNEAVSVGASAALKKGDIMAPTHRSLGAHFVLGSTLKEMAFQLFGRGEGPTKGKDNAIHQGSIEQGILGMISHLATVPALAAGCALAQKLKNTDRVSLAFIGDGGTSLGDFHETMNIASVMNLPFVMVIENNQWAYSTPNEKQFKCKKLSDRALGYGIPGETIDGTDVELVHATVSKAVKRARKGQGPTLIETITMRLKGHSSADEAEYVPKEMIRDWEKKHPVKLYREKLFKRKWLIKEEDDKLKDKLKREIDSAFESAESASYPEPYTCLEDVYAE